MKPLITVIVPVYNGQEYLLKCINCIQDQTYENIEIIVVDDGSKDGTAAICRSLETRYANDKDAGMSDKRRDFKCITLEDEGVSVARNRALECAAGEYVAFVDADDRIVPDMLQHLYEILLQSECDMAGCGFFMWNDENQWSAYITGTVADKYEVRKYEPKDYIEQEILRGNTRCWSKLYRRDVLRGICFESGLTIGEDMLFLVGLMEHIHCVCESSYQGYGYYQNESGAMQRKFTGHVMDQIYCWEKAREVLGASPEVDRHIVISTMLVVGRMAQLDRKERKAYRKEAACCYRKVRSYLSKEVYMLLDCAYKIKTLVYLLAPGVYVNLYQRWKNS